MFCSKCGTEIPDEANYCWQCGKAQKPSAQTGDITLEELNALIDSRIEERLRTWPGQRRDRPVAEVLASMRKNIIFPHQEVNPHLKCYSTNVHVVPNSNK